MKKLGKKFLLAKQTVEAYSCCSHNCYCEGPGSEGGSHWVSDLLALWNLSSQTTQA